MINEIIRGASATWKDALNIYLPSAGWTLKYYFRGAGAGLDLQATSEADDFVLTLTSAQTASFAIGEYAWQTFAEKDDERIFIAEGKLVVKQGFALAPAGEAIDTRSEIKKILDAIDACIKKKATADQLSYTIGNRQLARYSMADLIALRSQYQKLYNDEVRREKAKKGMGGLFKNIHYRFRNPR